MSIIQIITTSILFFTIIFSFGKKKDLLSPARIFTLVWGVSILLTEFKFSGFQHTWSDWAWIVLLIGLISFLLGNYVVLVLNSDRKIKSISQIRKAASENINFNNLFYIILALFVIYTIGYFLEVAIIGTLPIFAKRLDEARTEFGVFGLHIFVTFQLTIMTLCVEYLLLNHGDRLKRIILITIFIITLFTFALLLQRFNYFVWAAISLAIAYYSSKFFTYKKILLASGVFFGMLALIQSIRLSQYAQNFIYVISEMKYSKEYAIFTEPYMYITMNLENMARGVDMLENYSYGVITADWVLALAGIKHWLADYFTINARPFLISGYNTFPFLWNYYSDFGIFGVFLFAFLSGFIISLIYFKMRSTGLLKWIVYYSVCFMMIVISFFTNPLTMLTFTSNLILIVFIHEFLLNKPHHIDE